MGQASPPASGMRTSIPQPSSIRTATACGRMSEKGLPLVPTNIRFRDGSFSNFNSTDLDGVADFNEEFPLFTWYVVETDPTRYKNTGTHVVYDAGGPSDGRRAADSRAAPCGSSTIAHYMANTYEQNPLPGNLHVPGAVYCNDARLHEPIHQGWTEPR